MMTLFTSSLLVVSQLCFNSAVADDASVAQVRIDAELEHQTMDGFGASGAWWSPQVGGWDDENLDPLLDLLFTEKGADLSVFRYNLGAGSGEEITRPWRKTPSIPRVDGEFDLTADANALRVLRGARDRGVEQFAIFAISPPAELTISGMVSGGIDGQENLRDEDAPAYARWFVDRAVAVKTALALENVVVSPVNEPMWSWGKDNRSQEGSYFDAQTTLNILKATARRIDQLDADLKLIGPEAGAWGESALPYFEKILADPLMREKLHRLAIHSYHSTHEERLEMVRWLDERGRPIPLAMTEWCELKSGSDFTMDSAMVMAKTMHRDIVDAGVVEWTYWLAASPHDYRDGLIEVGWKQQRFRHNKRLWTIAHYSRFIRPGAKRIAAEVHGDESLLVSAYRPSESQQLVIVLTNPTDQEREVSVPALSEAQGVTLYVTDETRDLERSEHAAATISVPPMSLITVVADR